MNTRRACQFCATALEGNRAVEHIIPQWLIKHLQIEDIKIGPAVLDINTGKIRDERQHNIGRFLEGRVCSTCNQGWMSALEQATQPILTRLIANQQELINLTDPEKFTLARWIFKTACVMNSAGGLGDPRKDPEARPVPVEHMRTLYADALPGGVLLVGGGYNSDYPLEFMQSTSWTWPKLSMPLQEDDKKASYKIGFAFHGLILAAAYFPNPDYTYGLQEGIYVPLWTGDRGVELRNQPLHDLPPLTTSPMLEGFLENIWAVSKTWLKILENVNTTNLIQMPTGGC
jgi:hypothetical protein